MTDTIFTTYKIKLPLTELKPGMDAIAEMIWRELTAFQDWHKWMPATKEVTRVDEGVIGRGSTLRVTAHNTVKIWSISCWDPPRRIEFIVGSSNRNLAYGFSLVTDRENKELVIVLDVECSPRGLQRLMIPLFSWLQKRQSQKLLNCFVESFQTQ